MLQRHVPKCEQAMARIKPWTTRGRFLNCDFNHSRTDCHLTVLLTKRASRQALMSNRCQNWHFGNHHREPNIYGWV